MLRITVEVCPRGDTRAPREVAVVLVTNDQTGDEHIGHYGVQVDRPHHPTLGAVIGFVRWRGALALAAEALRAAVAEVERSDAAIRDRGRVDW